MEAMTKIPFIWTTSYHLDEAPRWRISSFPEPGSTEKYCFLSDTLRQPLLDKPLYDTRQVEDILIEIADRAGFLKDFNTRINNRMRLKAIWRWT